MTYLTEPEPVRGVALPVAPGVRRVVAANRGPTPITAPTPRATARFGVPFSAEFP